jgi:hypothetical protein
MQCLEVSSAVRCIYMSLGGNGLTDFSQLVVLFDLNLWVFWNICMWENE